MSLEISPQVVDGAGYSPIQRRFGVYEPGFESFPPLAQRVDQQTATPCEDDLAKYNIGRVTMQKDDVCNLHCPGCYVGQWLETDGAVRVSNPRRRTSPSEVADQLAALPSVKELFLLGAEPTMFPEETAETLRSAAEQGLTIMSITNGQANPERNERTFKEAVTEHGLHKLTVSIDSIDPATNDFLRGKSGALTRSLATIEQFLREGYPVKAQLTIWQANYPTILATVEHLYELGVRGFAFHSGSVEGVPDSDQRGLAMVEPLAWRALCDKLLAFAEERKEDLRHFNVPLVYFTEHELRYSIFQDETLVSRYLDHVQAVESGSSEPLPMKACPAYGTPEQPGPPQIYIYANDRPTGEVSICNIHTGATGRKFARWDPETKKFEVIQGPSNQMEFMLQSPYLCPAMTEATGGHKSDRVSTPAGFFYHGCRYWSNNQIPGVEKGAFAKYYDGYATTYSAC